MKENRIMKFVGKLIWRLYSTKIILLSKVAWLQRGESHVLVHLLVCVCGGVKLEKRRGKQCSLEHAETGGYQKWTGVGGGGAETEENQHALFVNALMKANPLYVNLRLERQPSG